MFELPIVYLLYAFYIFLAVWGVLSLIGIFHLLKPSTKSLGAYSIVLFYLGGAALIFIFLFNSAAKIDWNRSLEIGFSNNQFTNY